MFDCCCPLSWALAGLALYALCVAYEGFKFYVKMTIFGVGSFLLAAVLPLPLFVLRPRHYKNALGPAWGCRQLLRLLGCTFEIRGAEHIRRGHGAVVIINHQSFIDLAVLAHLWPIVGRATVVAKRLIMFIFPPAYGWGTLFIDRQNRADALGKMNAQAQAIREHHAKLLVFPEGTRSQSATLLPFKKGPFHIAVAAQAPLQPVVVSRYWFLDGERRKRFGRGHTIISVLPEIDCTGLDKTNIDELLAGAQLAMQTEFDRISAESFAVNVRMDSSLRQLADRPVSWSAGQEDGSTGKSRIIPQDH